MDNFLKILKERKISVNELSKRSGVHLRTIQNWIYGIAEPSLSNAEKVLNAMGYQLQIVKIEEERKT